MKILLVRHGETDYNKQHLVQGHTDIPLNATGIEQAKSAGSKLLDYEIEKAFSSPVMRAYDTCRYMLETSNKDLEITKDARVIEKHYGKFEGATYEDWHKRQAANDISTVELDENVANRVTEFIKEKYEQYSDKTILVVCHGACIRIFLESHKLIAKKEFIKNTSLNEVEFDGNNFTLNRFNI